MSKIPKIYKHNIEITKPWSREMYKYNQEVSSHMIKEIEFAINALSDLDTAKTLGKIIMSSGYGYGFTLESIKEDLLKNIDGIETWWLNEIWDDLIISNFVQPNFGEGNEVFHIIGCESKEEIKELRAKFA